MSLNTDTTQSQYLAAKVLLDQHHRNLFCHEADKLSRAFNVFINEVIQNHEWQQGLFTEFPPPPLSQREYRQQLQQRKQHKRVNQHAFTEPELAEQEAQRHDWIISTAPPRIKLPCLYEPTSLWQPSASVEPLLIKNDDDLYAVNLSLPPPPLIDDDFHTSFADNDLLTMPDPTPLPAEAPPQATFTNRRGRPLKTNAVTQVAASPPLEPVLPPKLMMRIGRTVNCTQKWEAASTPWHQWGKTLETANQRPAKKRSMQCLINQDIDELQA